MPQCRFTPFRASMPSSPRAFLTSRRVTAEFIGNSPGAFGSRKGRDTRGERFVPILRAGVNLAAAAVILMVPEPGNSEKT